MSSSVDVWCKGNGEQMQDVIVEEDAVRFCRVTTEEGGGGGGPGSTGGPITMDKDEKRMRREIANSNERRRMQSINAGFQSLRQMLPHHEGEKLSKAAILQQTAEYIYALEQEKTRLLSQNCALKRDRERDQQDHSAAEQHQQTQAQPQTIVPAAAVATAAAVTTVAKKRKIDAMVAVSDSSDEGLGSMSPEPVSLMQVVNNATGQTIVTAAGNGRGTSGPTISVSAKDYLELKHQLEVERRQKAIFEERLKALERQIYPARVLYPDIVEANETIEEIAVAAIPAKPVAKISRELENVQLITLDSGLIAKKQLVAVCSGGPEVIEETIVPISKTLNIVPVKEEKVFIKRSRSRSPTIIEQPPVIPQPQQQTTVVTLPPKKNRFPTILEAAIKAEPKVEVERINSPSSIVVNDEHLSHLTNSSKLVTSQQQQQQANSRINTCRHNLETIVEAIRHLEGDAFDSVAPVQQQQQQQLTISRPAAVQEVPLALTTSSKQHQQKERDHRQSQLEPYLKFRTTPAAAAAVTTSTIAPASSATSASSSNPSGHPAIVSVSITPTLSPAATAVQQTASQILQQHQQCRPGVIVVKQNS